MALPGTASRLHLLTDQLADRLARDHFDTPDDITELAKRACSRAACSAS
jgi:hypothetical protein